MIVVKALNMKKNNGFSLIEIIQTVVLLGIIAGLSVSFFTKFNADEKLQEPTEIKLYNAIQEANKQMCNDETPYCSGTATDGTVVSYEVNTTNHCCVTSYGANVTFDNMKKLCSISLANAGGVNCPAGMSLSQNDDGTPFCYGKPMCYSGGCAAGNELRVSQPAGDHVAAQPLHEIVCAANVPHWSSYIQRNVAGNEINSPGFQNVTEICYRLWSLLNHEPVSTDANADGTIDEADDLLMTCNTRDAAPYACMYSVGATPGKECSGNGSTPQPNLTLPNGIMLYNLECIGRAGCPGAAAVANKDGQNIYIKYDRNFQMSTFNWSTNDLHKTGSIFNAIQAGGAINTVPPALPNGGKIVGNDTYYKYSETLNGILNTETPPEE